VVLDSVLESTTATAISARPRLSFESASVEEVLLEVDGVMTLNPALLPSRDILVAWARRLKARHSKLKSFRFRVSYTMFEFFGSGDPPANNEMLDFAYCEEVDEDDHAVLLPSIRENMDLRSRPVDDAHLFKYQTYPNNIKACHRRLLRDAMMWRQELARRTVTART
jgi:hypothetical protein